MRCFVGIKVNAYDSIIEFQNDIKRNFHVKLVEPENLHVTLKFLGEIDEKHVGKISAALKRIDFRPFEVKMIGAGAFPREERARVIWIALISRELNELGETVSTILSDYGDERFSPHLTVARLKDMANVTGILKNYKEKNFGLFNVESFEIYRSTLTPQGPIYEEIEKISAK